MKYEDFVSRFQKSRKTARGVMVACPHHDDNPKTPSLAISRGKDGGVLVKCFAGCTAEEVVGSLGLKMKDLFAGEMAVPFTVPTAVESSKPVSNEKPLIEKIYSYQDANGDEVYQALRMTPKSFRQRHANPENPLTWVWTMDGVERVLYRLPEVLKANQVWIVEGEKDADNLAELGFCSTCNVGGAGKWLDSYSESLKGKEIVICGDNDEAGKKHVDLVFNSLAATSKTVRIIKLPETVKDASDYIATFKDKSEAKEALHSLVSMSQPHVKGLSLPLFTISELEADYRRFVRSMEQNSFSLGKWLPSLGKIRPLVPGELVFIIGDTGTGKTGTLQQISTAALPLPTVLFQLELPKELMFERYSAMATKMTAEQIEQAYQSADDSISDRLDIAYKNLLVCVESRLTVPQIESIIMRAELKLGERPRVVLIDYIQLIGGSGPNRREKISDIAEDLKVMAKATRTIVIVTSQIRRGEDEEPSLHSAKESGSIESSCGLLLGAWQDAEQPGTLNFRVLKSTKGGTGMLVKCNFDGARMLITEKSKLDDADIPQRTTKQQYND